MKLVNKIISKAIALGERIAGGVSQKEALEALGEPTVTDGMPELLRRAAAQGAVLLKNDGVLPFKKGATVSVYSRLQKDWFFTGYGSGGDVKLPYKVNLIDGLRNCGDLNVNEELAAVYESWCEEHPVNHGYWGHWPRYYQDMELSGEIVKNAASKSDCAVFVIGRSSGEDRENALEKGSFYLTDREIQSLDIITEYFDSVTVLLNIGSIIDMSWVKKYGDKIGAVMILWQGGMESGNAAADLLCGKASPSGKLSDTVAESYEDYPSSESFGNKEYNEYNEDIYVGYRYFETFAPEKVIYPFGFGLSYTEFKVDFDCAEEKGDSVLLKCRVTNTGSVPGRETVQVYAGKPVAPLGNPAKELVAFEKTKTLEPSQSEEFVFEIPVERFASYDDCGKSAYAYSYIMPEGEYSLYLGCDVRSASKVWSFTVEKTKPVQKLSQTSAPRESFERFVNDGGRLSKEKVKLAEYDLKKIILDSLPVDIEMTGDKGYKLDDVKSGKITLEQFTAQLSLTELEAISRGDYTMDSPLGAKGNAGAIGGVLESLREKGVVPIITTDGPSGIRLLSYCSLIPIGTALACSFDKELVREVYSAVSKEMKAKGSDVLLAPGMNIHRNPLCGRNFEYYSEDPVLTGEIAAAAVSGIQSTGVSACPKHFACNNQEFNRTHNDSRLSERALREIYLKGFEICIKQAAPRCIMTSYNKINGVWGHYNYELCQRVLRGEWGYEGMVMTDWWMRSSPSLEFPEMRDNAYRVRAGVDVLMPGGSRTGKRKPDKTLLETYGRSEGITAGEMQRTAMRVLKLSMSRM